ncbi:hypothetical protein ACP4OV_017044 [Aristida adscensionis]
MAGAKRERREEAPPPENPAAAAAAPASVAAVLGNDDLLAEILLRLGSPPWLLRAALVRRRWLRVASAPAFLARFRARHPPRALALVPHGVGIQPVLFRARHPPELAAAFARAAAALGPLRGYDRLRDYRGGRVLLELCDCDDDDFKLPTTAQLTIRLAVRSLLRAAPEAALPPPPSLGSLRDELMHFHYRRLFLLEDDHGGAASCLYLLIRTDKVRVRAGFSFLRSGVWGAEHSAVTARHNLFGDILLSGTKVYMMTTGGCILVLDLEARSFSTINLPDGVGRYPSAHEHLFRMTLKFSRAQQQPGVYLVEAAGFQLRIWRCDGVERWALVSTIPVREACDHLGVEAWEPGDGQSPPVQVLGVGDNAELVVLELVASGIVCYMDLANGIVEKVLHGRQRHDASFYPIAMVWPPVFPVLDKGSEEP